MLRRSAIVMLAACFAAGAPAGATAQSADELLAQTSSGGLSDEPRVSGGLSETPNPARPSAPSGTAARPAELPFTGSDPRVTLALGIAALLAGAGLRLRTGDARDY